LREGSEVRHAEWYSLFLPHADYKDTNIVQNGTTNASLTTAHEAISMRHVGS
jgi:hypothetical protein